MGKQRIILDVEIEDFDGLMYDRPAQWDWTELVGEGTVFVSAHTNVVELNHRKFAVVDMDSGTVLGTNVCLVPFPDDEEEREALLNSDSTSFTYATEHGIPVYADVQED